ncbi:hypothetical protein D3C87_1642300 [compost metagenome]
MTPRIGADAAAKSKFGPIKAKAGAKAIEKNRTVSITVPIIDAASGAFHQVWRRSSLKTEISRSWPIRKAVPDAIAMRGSDSQKESATPTTKPTNTMRRAIAGPNWRLARSVTRKATG